MPLKLYQYSCQYFTYHQSWHLGYCFSCRPIRSYSYSNFCRPIQPYSSSWYFSSNLPECLPHRWPSTAPLYMHSKRCLNHFHTSRHLSWGFQFAQSIFVALFEAFQLSLCYSLKQIELYLKDSRSTMWTSWISQDFLFKHSQCSSRKLVTEANWATSVRYALLPCD